jgi:hypothetical protein
MSCINTYTPSLTQYLSELKSKCKDKLHHFLIGQCDRTTSKVRGLSPKIILGDSRWSENAQTHTNKHTIPNMKFKLKLLQIKCHVLGFTKDEAQNVLQKIIRVCGSVRLSR